MMIVLEEVQEQCEQALARVKRNPYCFEDEIFQSEAVCLEAVRKRPDNLQWVKRQTLEICVEAVKKEPCAFQYVHPDWRWRVQQALNLKHLPPGPQNAELLVVLTEANEWRVFNLGSLIRVHGGVEINDYLEQLNSVQDASINCQIQRQFFQAEGFEC